MKQMDPLPGGIRVLNDQESARLHRLYPNLPATPDQCITCGGTGSFKWWGDDNAHDEWKCNCRDQWVLHRFLLNAGIELSYQRLAWRDTVAVEDGAISQANAYLTKSASYVNAGLGLILYGGKGSGKTLLSTLMIKRLLADGIDAYFSTYADMLTMFSSTFRDQDEKAWFYRRVKNVGVLVLDDIGRERKVEHFLTREAREKLGNDLGVAYRTSQLSESTFDEVLRHRVAASLPTIITTNLDLKALMEGYGENVMSLLHERSATYRFTGEDFRDQARHRLLDEIEQGLTRPVVIG